MRNSIPAMILTALAVASCGGSDSDDAFSPGTGTVTPPGTPPGTVAVEMGSPAGTSFQSGIIGITSANLAAGGSTSLQVALQRADGTLHSQAADISFNSPCIAQGRATIQSPVSTSTGIANATYVAAGCSGADVITASAVVNGQTLTASGTVTVATAAIGSIEFVSATPPNIALRGTGGPGRQETSTVIFRVVDASGGPRPDADVTFSLDTQVGGINLTATTARSGADGQVQTVVNAGTVATTVRVTARIATPAISTQSSQLTITTGIPDTDSFSVAPQCPNVEAFNIDGVTVPVTARLADRFNNPVPDGTAVTFQSEGGSIIGQCQTTTTATEGGVCTATWRSSDPRPLVPAGQEGRVTILATAIGEDSFADANSNGFFDAGETFADLGEPFRDDNENGVRDGTEPFFDFNNSGTYESGDGAFSGVTCTGTGAGSSCNLTTTGIGDSTLIIMSTSGADITGPAVEDFAPGEGRAIAYLVRDLNGNAMPRGTTITATANTGAGTLSPPSSFTVPCDASQAGTDASVFLTTPTIAGTGAVTVTVTSPGGIITRLTTTITN